MAAAGGTASDASDLQLLSGSMPLLRAVASAVLQTAVTLQAAIEYARKGYWWYSTNQGVLSEQGRFFPGALLAELVVCRLAACSHLDRGQDLQQHKLTLGRQGRHLPLQSWISAAGGLHQYNRAVLHT